MTMERDLLVLHQMFTSKGTPMFKLERWVAAGTLSLACMVGAQPAQAANIVASEAILKGADKVKGG